MDKTSKLFDVWAKTGRSEEMEKGHGTTVNQFLDKLSLKEKFRFLDIGCGNGWVVRKLSQKSSFNSITGIDCSWALAEDVFQKNFVGTARKLPPLLAGNPVNYSKINKMTTVEAIAGAAFILGEEELSRKLLEKFNWGHTFLELNENLLHDYQKVKSEDQVNEIIREYGYAI